MEASAFDTNKYANRLVEAGVSQENANLQADAVGEIMHAVMSLEAKVEKYHAEDLIEFASIRAQLSELDARVTKELAGQRVLIAGQEGKLIQTNSRMTVIEGRMASMEGRMTSMEDRMTSMEDRMTSLDERLTSMRDKLAEMNQRLAVLEAQIASMEARIDAKLSALEKRLMRWILIVGSALGLLQTALILAPRYLG
jgi:chromosome segregation ATPase